MSLFGLFHIFLLPILDSNIGRTDILLVMMADRKMKAAKGAFDASIDGGITLIDTAEVYGSMVGKYCILVSFLFPPFYFMKS